MSKNYLDWFNEAVQCFDISFHRVSSVLIGTLKDIVAGTGVNMDSVKAEMMDVLTPPPSDVGSPSHTGSPLSQCNSDSEPDSPFTDEAKVRTLI